jgi:hypothetical protein
VNEPRRDDRCIERRSIIDSAHFYSVQEYEEGLAQGKSLSSSRARSFHEVIWTEGAPKVEELTIEWQETKEGKFRIRDWDVYDSQMRRLIGLD